jgi:UDP-3-O-[3-hydroxymyristoyl] N-acetylglucosamine deacetylase
MRKTHEQHTLRETLVFEGVGLHTGVPSRVQLIPQPAGGGIRFRLDGAVEFPAHAEYVVDSERATVVGCEGKTVTTVEHLLSALCGMEVDNVLIDVEGPEIPVCDGSAGVFADAIARGGLAGQGVAPAWFRVAEPSWYRDGDALLVVLPADEWRIRFAVDYPAPIGAQFYDAAMDPERYRAEVAPSRTFGYLHEVEALLERGLARGGTLDNALVFAPDGPLTPLRAPNEVVTHKVLDLVGDLALLGARPQCEVVAIKSGHRLHARATRDLRERISLLGAVS